MYNIFHKLEARTKAVQLPFRKWTDIKYNQGLW